LLQVQDLHSITPDYFLEVSGAVIHPLSYQQVGWTLNLLKIAENFNCLLPQVLWILFTCGSARLSMTGFLAYTLDL